MRINNITEERQRSPYQQVGYSMTNACMGVVLLLTSLLMGCEFFTGGTKKNDLDRIALTPDIDSRSLSAFESTILTGYESLEELVADIDTLGYSAASSIIENEYNYYLLIR